MYTIASEEAYKDGQIIIKEGSPGDWVYVVLSGGVEISKMVEGEKVVIEILGEGEVFGELGFLGGLKRTASAIAVGDTNLGLIDRAALDAEFNKLSSEFRMIISAIVKRFQKMTARIPGSLYRSEPRATRTLSLAYKDKSAFVKAYTDNISGGGLFVKTEKPLGKGEEFVLKLQLPGLPDPMRIKCAVVWERKSEGEPGYGPAGMGIKFLAMNKKDDQTLRQYIREITGKEPRP